MENLLNQNQPKKKTIIKFLGKHWRVLALAAITAAVMIPLTLIHILLSQVRGSFPDGSTLGLSSLLQASTTRLGGEDQDRTNILILGLTADDLRTDSILLASYYWKEKKLITLNIPRDLYISYRGYQGKVVSLYELERANHPTSKTIPPEEISKFISDEFNIPIHYYFVNNFDALKEIVDTMGGITITVDRSFSDSLYPDDNFGYLRPVPHFNAGVQHMDGTEALIFSRSRQSQDQPLEASDFARSLRQEKVIGALMAKFKSQSYITDLSQLNSYLGIFARNIYTNMSSTEMIRLSFALKGLDFSKDYLKANWSLSSGFFCDTNADGQYVLKYGIAEDCSGIGGVNDPSVYRQAALKYVGNLLSNASK